MKYFLILFIYHCQGDIFVGNALTTDSDVKLQDNIIECNENEDCSIVCQNYDNSCQNTSIKCPIYGNCHLICSSETANNICKNVSLTCPINGNCNLLCVGNSACQNVHINGKTSNALTIICEGYNTCDGAIIDARDTMHFVLECGIGSINTCSSLTIFFPPNSNGEKKAIILAGDQFSAGINDIPMQFYAYNGWNDINIFEYIGTYDHQIGTIHCGSVYDNSCSFKSNAWECVNKNDICNHAINLRQTETETVSTLRTKQLIIDKTDTFTLTLLYCIIGILILCSCCLICISYYYINLTHQYGKKLGITKNTNTSQTIANQSISELLSQTIRSTSKSINSPTLNGEININKIEMQQQEPPQPLINTNILYQHQKVPLPPINTSAPSISSLIPIEQIEEMESYNKHHHISVPCTNISIQTSLSSNNDNINNQIVYQQPEQHQALQMILMMNESPLPSLSEFINNTNSVINQNPIPPNDIYVNEISRSDSISVNVSASYNK
eukprot:364989_1